MLRIMLSLSQNQEDNVRRHLYWVAFAALVLAPQLAVAGGHMMVPQPKPAPVTVVADFDRPRMRRAARPRRYVYGEWYTPGQHWQPWAPGRHHRYWHGGVTSAFCYGIYSVPERRCYDRDW
jgi:hypothetical protein